MLDQVALLPADLPPALFPEQPELSRPKRGRTRLRVLVVDDEHLIAQTVAAILNGNGFEAVEAFTGEQAIEIVRKFRPDIILSDVLMPRMTGVELGMQVRREFPDTRIVLFSGQAATAELVRKAKAEGSEFELFPKPIHPEELIARLRDV